MSAAGTKKFNSISTATDFLWSHFQHEIRLATPLGLGKPNQLLNAIYDRVKKNSSLQLKIYTALSLGTPQPKEDLEKRFFLPFLKRHWGDDYPDLHYARDAVANRLPKNVQVHEFYFQAGAALNSPALQQNYQSLNYTHVAHEVFESNIQMIVQLIAKDPKTGRYSLSCNPDLTLDVVDLFKNSKKEFLMVGVVHPDLPFLSGDAEVAEDFFQILVEDPDVTHPLFALPKLPVSAEDHAIGFYASQLIKDGGTLQIGIGSLSDAVVAALLLRHQQNAHYLQMVESQWQAHEKPHKIQLETSTFKDGLYGLSEMVMDGFMYLRQAHILKREVVDERSHTKTYLHGAFFLGSKEFYAWLKKLSPEDFQGLRMGRVSKVNDLYDENEIALRRQRKHPRFLNTCMQVTLLGGAASETLEDGRVVSGVGGQYNFVAMAHELPDSRSILMLRSVRTHEGKRSSNIVWSHGQLTIPRHLRDIVVTEYGIADIRGRTDEEVVRALIQITDVEFQDELVKVAKKYGKLDAAYQVPASARLNTRANVHRFIGQWQSAEVFAQFPFGSDFSPIEVNLMNALQKLQATISGPKLKLISFLVRAFFHFSSTNQYSAELERMQLDSPKTIRERIYRRFLLLALEK